MKKISLFVLIFLSLTIKAWSQTKDSSVYLSHLDDLVITDIIQVDSTNKIIEINNPKEFWTYLTQNITHTTETINAGISGKIIVQFDIDSLGEINNLEMIRCLHPALDNQVFQAFSAMPQLKTFSTTFSRRVRYQMDIKFERIYPNE